MGNNLKLTRPGPSSSPCLAILEHASSKLILLSLNGGTSRVLKISDHESRGIAAINDQVYIVTETKILRVNSDGTTTSLAKFDRTLEGYTQIVSFQNKLYILQPHGNNMKRFDPADRTLNTKLPGCKVGDEFCCCGTDKFIYTMGGWTDAGTMKYDPVTNQWTSIASIKYGRMGSSSAAMNNRIYVLGGRYNPPAEFYDLESSTWTEISRMNVQRRWFSSCVIDNQLYAVCGDSDEHQQSVEVYDGNQWNIVTTFRFKKFTAFSRFSACVWPHGSHQADLQKYPKQNNRTNGGQVLEKSTGKLNTKQHSAHHNQSESEPIGQEGGNIKLPDTEIKIPEGSLPEDKKISFSTRTVSDQEDNLIDVTPRLQTNSLVEFSIPVSVKMDTSISAPTPGESIPLILQQRDNQNEKWEEIDQILVGERNNVDFTLSRGRETRIAIDLRKIEKRLNKKFRKWRKGVVDRFRIRIHAREDFYINRKTLFLIATFAKDRNTQNNLKADLLSKDFVPFSIHPHQFSALSGTKVTPRMVCEYPEESKIKSEVYPTSSFTVDNDFLVNGTQCFDFLWEQEPSDDCKRVKLMFECSVGDDIDHKLPLAIDWPLQGKQNGRCDDTIEEILKSKTVKHDSLDLQSAVGSTKKALKGAVGWAGESDIIAQILMKEEEILILCYSQRFDETRMIAHLTEDKLFKLVNPIPVPVCSYTDSSIKLQLIVYPPNEKNVTIQPACHDADVEGIRRGPAAAFTFLCKSNKRDLDATIEFRVMENNDIKSKYPFDFKCDGIEQTATRSENATGLHVGDGGKIEIHGNVKVEAKT